MTRNSIFYAAVILWIGLGSAARTRVATPTPAETVTAEEVVIEAEAESDESVQGPFLPAVQGTHINSGKKSSVIDLDEFPRITNNNYRQALAKTPGLFVSEETTPLVSIGYRGLNPDRVQFTQVLKDGIPIHADQFGYPEAYYTPPLDTVDRIEFLCAHYRYRDRSGLWTELLRGHFSKILRPGGHFHRSNFLIVPAV